MTPLRLSLLFPVFFSALLFPGPAAQPRFPYEPGHFIVQLADSGAMPAVLAALRCHAGKTAKIHTPKQLCADPPIWLLKFDPAPAADKALLAFVAGLPGVALAQHDHHLSLRATFPDDPLFPAQWQWHNDGVNGTVADADVDAPEAWEISSGGVTPDGDTIVVAVIDDGVRLRHPDLAPNLWRNHGEIPNNHVDDDDNGYTDDYYGWNTAFENGQVDLGFHGTQVAGILAARGGNATGVAGMAGHARIMPIVGGAGLESEVIQAYAYALAQRRAYNQSNGRKGAFIVATNSSWGVDGLSYQDAPVWCGFYGHLGQAGMINCAATANRDWNVDEAGDMPTSCPSPFLISVTASNSGDQRGEAAYGPLSVDLAAPGIGVLTTSPGDTYALASGTSYASPLVAGIAALLYAAPCSGLSALAKAAPAQAALAVKQLILEGADTLPQLAGSLSSGGRANARKSLARLLARCSDCPAPASFTAEQHSDGTALLDWQPGHPASLYWRLQGTSAWASLGQPLPPYLFEGLSPCNAYEFMLLAHCPLSDSWPSLAALQAKGCCPAPAEAWLAEATPETAVIGWEASAGTAFHTAQLWRQGENLAAGETDGNQFAFSGLSPCSDYEALLISNCPGNQHQDTLAFTFRTPGCGPCTNLPYCPSAAAPGGVEWIASFSIGGFHNPSGQDDGYGDFTHLPVRLQAGQAYSFTIEPGFLHLPFPEHYRIWADFDQDGHFAGPEELLFETAFGAQGPVSGQILIPETAAGGSVRLRLSMKWAGNSSSPPQPCEENIEFGEVEDYCLSVEDFLSSPSSAACSPEMNLFPNPFRENLHLEWGCPPEHPTRVRFFNSTGQLLFEQVAAPGTPSFPLRLPPGLAPGPYFLQVESSGKSAFQTVIKNQDL